MHKAKNSLLSLPIVKKWNIKHQKKNHYNEALHPLRLTEPSSVVQARSISDSISFIIRKVWCFQNIFTINSNYYNMLRWPSYERTLVVTEVNLQCSWFLPSLLTSIYYLYSYKHLYYHGSLKTFHYSCQEGGRVLYRTTVFEPLIDSSDITVDSWMRIGEEIQVSH